jgi:hypothetical protein
LPVKYTQTGRTIMDSKELCLNSAGRASPRRSKLKLRGDGETSHALHRVIFAGLASVLKAMLQQRYES